MKKNILVLAMGNDIIGDDGAAFVASKILNEKYSDDVDFEEVFGGGLEILDFLEGCDKALVLDTISTGTNPIGTVIEFKKDDFRYISASSPHYMGLPEVIKLADIFKLEFPNEIKILAIETEVQNDIIEGLSPLIEEKITDMVKRSSEIIDAWLNA